MPNYHGIFVSKLVSRRTLPYVIVVLMKLTTKILDRIFWSAHSQVESVFFRSIRKKKKRTALNPTTIGWSVTCDTSNAITLGKNLSYPNLDTLVNLSEYLAVPLDILLKGDGNLMVNKISQDVRVKGKYKHYLTVILAIFILIFWCCIIKGLEPCHYLMT